MTNLSIFDLMNGPSLVINLDLINRDIDERERSDLPVYMTFISTVDYLIFIQAQGYLTRKNEKLRKEIFKCIYLSLFINAKLFLKSESLILFKLNQLMVAIGKKLAPGDHESSLKIKFASCPLQDVTYTYISTKELLKTGFANLFSFSSSLLLFGGMIKEAIITSFHRFLNRKK